MRINLIHNEYADDDDDDEEFEMPLTFEYILKFSVNYFMLV